MKLDAEPNLYALRMRLQVAGHAVLNALDGLSRDNWGKVRDELRHLSVATEWGQREFDAAMRAKGIYSPLEEPEVQG